VNSRLANISSRGFVSTGEDVMIGGFFVGGGEVDTRVVIRALGPSLANSGVSNELADPTLSWSTATGTESARTTTGKIPRGPRSKRLVCSRRTIASRRS
jgi:hypothetical protein